MIKGRDNHLIVGSKRVIASEKMALQVQYCSVYKFVDYGRTVHKILH